MWFTSDGIFVCEINAVVEREAGVTREDLHVAANLDELPGRPAKIMCVARSPEKQAAFEHLKHALAGRLMAVRSHARLLELGSSEAGKASAAAIIANMLGIEPHNTVAAGDGENDIEMLRQAGCAITVANAVPAIRDFADFVGSSCDDGGLAEGIDWIIDREKRGNPIARPFKEEADA
jgi:hydroxymethylpyrimidine pyrophosphatase-like HAD family hydrolase